MNNFIKSIIMLSLALCVIMVTGSYSVKAEEPTMVELQVEEVDDIASAISSQSASTDNINTVFKFKLTKPAYVVVGVNQTFNTNWGYKLDAVITSDPNGGSVVYFGLISGPTAPQTRKAFLEAGTYYIKLKINDAEILDNSGKFSASVIAQYVDRTISGNTTIMKAKEVDIDTPIVGFLSSSVHKQFYKIKLDHKSKVNINFLASIVYYTGDDSTMGRVYDKNFKRLKEVDIASESASINTTLSPGTYYVSIEQYPAVLGGIDNYNYFGETFINIDTTNVKLVAPKNVVAKAGKKIITGTAEKNSEVYIVYNNDTFFATADSKGKFKVEVDKLVKGKTLKLYAVKSGDKSSVTKVTIK